MQDWQDSAVANGIQELVNVPGSSQGCGFRLTVPDDSRNDQVWIIEGGATGMGEHVAQLAAFVNRPRRFRRAVASNTSGKRELLEKRPHPFFVLTLIGVDLGVGSFQINRADDSGGAVPWSGKKNDVHVVLLDDPVQVYVDKRQART